MKCWAQGSPVSLPPEPSGSCPHRTMTFQCFLILLVAQLPTSQAEIGHVKPNIDDKKCFHLVSCECWHLPYGSFVKGLKKWQCFGPREPVWAGTRGSSAALCQFRGITLRRLCQEAALLRSSDAHTRGEIGNTVVGHCRLHGVPRQQFN